MADQKIKGRFSRKKMSLKEKTLAESHQIELKSKQQIIDLKDEEISRIKDMKSKCQLKKLVKN